MAFVAGTGCQTWHFILQEAVQISEMQITEEMKTCSAEDLFSHIAKNVVSFASSVGRSDHSAINDRPAICHIPQKGALLFRSGSALAT